ncbi:MAG: alginate export family protein, partial [Acidiferrobacterales bacterium]
HDSGPKTHARIVIGLTLLLAAPVAVSENTQPLTRRSHVYLSQATTGERSVDPDQEDSKKVLEIGGGFELNGTTLNNVTLGQQSGDNVQMSDQEIQAELSYRPSTRMSIFGELKLIAEQEDRDDATPRISEEGVERGETWLHLENLFDTPYALKIGRQNFFEPRRWWWDDDLDAISLNYLHDRWQVYVGYGEEFGRTSSIEDFIDPENEDVERLLGHANWRVSQTLDLGAFYLRQRDNSGILPVGSIIETAREDESDADLNWFGLRASGEIPLSRDHGLSYWADTAIVDGDETLLGFNNAGPGLSRVGSLTRRDIRGWAIDLGLLWTLPWRGAPTVTISHAHGSGDKDLTDDTDRSFRQTGLQDSDEEFRTYGELLRPELSNLRVSTVALTFPVHTKTYLTLGYHRFRQVYAAPFLRDARIEAGPTGNSKHIGQELSLLAELRKWENLEVDLATAIFESGDAFGVRAGERAKSLFVKLAYEF